MPYKSESIRIEGTRFDRRIKLTSEDKEAIKLLRKEEGTSYQKIANQFNVSKRMIIFICKPETYEASKLAAKLRGAPMIYYDREKATEVKREHREYKQNLLIAGLISYKTAT